MEEQDLGIGLPIGPLINFGRSTDRVVKISDVIF